jgi:fatty acid kinase
MDIATARERARASKRNLEAHRQRIDDLNVYPVPDGDTGTNLLRTVQSIVEALEASEATGAAAVARELSRAALMGARGNSGVILSQIVRGFAEVLGQQDEIDGEVLARAFRSASDAAYRAVQRPVEGTMLTVIREMAEEAERPNVRVLAKQEVLRHVVERGEEAVRRTPELLDVLAEAGVVDAGGAGLLELVRGVYLSTAGLPLPDTPVAVEELTLDAVDHGASRYRYCTNFVVVGEGLDRDALYEELARIGDSLHVVGDAETLRVHVHTDEPELALALAGDRGAIAGEATEISDMHEQIADRDERLSGLVSDDEAARLEAIPTLRTGVVAVVLGEGNRALFAERATRLVEGGQTMNPSVGELVAAVDATPAEQVVILPNNGNVVLAAREAVKQTRIPAHVVPTRSMQAGLVALHEGFHSHDGAEENVERMNAVLESVRTGELTRAARTTAVDGIEVAQGDWLGLVGERAVVAGPVLETVLGALVEQLVGGSGLLEVLVGADAGEARAALDRLSERLPHLELHVYDGGQPDYPLLLWTWVD